MPIAGAFGLVLLANAFYKLFLVYLEDFLGGFMKFHYVNYYTNSIVQILIYAYHRILHYHICILLYPFYPHLSCKSHYKITIWYKLHSCAEHVMKITLYCLDLALLISFFITNCNLGILLKVLYFRNYIINITLCKSY